MSSKAKSILTPSNAIIHPLVLLSVVDHYHRTGTNKKRDKRALGVLLGSSTPDQNGETATIDVRNSFAVPFEEDNKDNKIWFLDHTFLENMAEMFKKVSANEKIVGFYSTGPKIRANDLDIDLRFQKYVQSPLFLIVDLSNENVSVPCSTYVSEEIVNEKKSTSRSFRTVKNKVAAYEAEEVGVEHLLRDIHDPTVSTLSARVKNKKTGLSSLMGKLEEIYSFLGKVQKGEARMNNEIIYNIQEILNLLPNLKLEELVKALNVKNNDLAMVTYIAQLARSILGLTDLLNNQIEFEEHNKKLTDVQKPKVAT
eukprot:snap_masked-scaffold_36-processed-gene-2.78-mRNA-1 protein AED:0.02 eAED:0.02 QI:0/-1/0/1/-1/1/1/0/310